MARDHSETKVPVAVVVMTYNEEANVERCLRSVQGWAEAIYVVDSFSADRTLEIVRRYTAHVYQHAYEGHPQQWRWALDTLPFEQEWILALDADFQVTAALWQAIRTALAATDPRVSGYYVRHRQIFRGRFLRHGTMYPRYWLRLFRRQRVRVDPQDLVDLHFSVQGSTRRLEHDVIEDNHKEREMRFWIEKQTRFAQRQALEELQRRRAKAAAPIQPKLFGNPDQRTLWLKERWYGLPPYLRPFLFFFYRYVLRGGFLDGKEGFLYHFTQALLYRLLVDVRLDELQARRGPGSNDGTEERKV